MSKKEEIKLAFEIGKDAFKRFLKRVPASDPKFLQMLANRKIGTSKHIYKSWYKG